MELLNSKQEELRKICSACMVDELYVFGSILTDQFNANSDLDFIVSFFSDDPIQYAENYFKLKFDLEKIFDRKIDLLEQKAIRNQTFESIINNNKKLIYAGRNQDAA